MCDDDDENIKEIYLYIYIYIYICMYVYAYIYMFVMVYFPGLPDVFAAERVWCVAVRIRKWLHAASDWCRSKKLFKAVHARHMSQRLYSP